MTFKLNKSSQVTRYLLRLMPQAMNAFAAGDEWRTAPLLNMLLLLLLLLLPPPPPEASAEKYFIFFAFFLAP